ncbi:MAG TPA: hypothetical protein DER40_06405 [Geobacter sp.]|nr:hypothetical protein [Geobacter sp.]HCE67149.1 hypothetical protein [Geobacter sp.]
MMSQKETLEDLVEFRKTPEELQDALKGFPWDSEELVQLGRQHVSTVLKRYLAGEISTQEVDDWANLIECRDDIDYEDVADVLHILANPLITNELTSAVAAQFIEELRKPNMPLEPTR